MKIKRTKYILTFFSLVILLGGLFTYQQAKFNDGKLHVVFCDVGQGDAIYIRTPSGKDILVDGGPSDRVLNCLSRHMPFWDKTIDLMILSHPHADHITGLISVLDRYSLIYYASEKVENLNFLQTRLQDKLAAKNLTANYLKTGDRIVFSDKIEIKTFWPDKNAVEKYTIASKSANFDLDANGLCLVQLLSFADFKLLLTGDTDISVLNRIEKEIGDVDILKVAHHGSKTGTNSQFLDEITPEIAIISVGKDNKYGHPTKEVLDLLEEKKIKTLRTDENGEVEIIVDREKWMLNAN